MTFKKGDEVLIKGTVLSFEEGEILDLEIATSENTFFVNSEDVQMLSKVDQEQLYTVKIPNPNIIGNECLVLMRNGFKQIVAVNKIGDGWRKEKAFQLTEHEIKQDFEWAWEWAKPAEEVE